MELGVVLLFLLVGVIVSSRDDERGRLGVEEAAPDEPLVSLKGGEVSRARSVDCGMGRSSDWLVESSWHSCWTNGGSAGAGTVTTASLYSVVIGTPVPVRVDDLTTKSRLAGLVRHPRR